MDSGEKIEYATEIPLHDYNELKEKRVSKLLTKRRHSISFDNHIGFYDEYHGEIELKIVTMEFETFEEMYNFKKPNFLDVFVELSVEKISK